MAESTPEATEAVARLLYARDGYAPWETEEPNEQETYRIQAAELIAAALPHLRVQETPPLELAESARAIAARLRIDLESVDREDTRIALGNSARDVIRLAELIEAPHPRPVVDREAIAKALFDRMQQTVVFPTEWEYTAPVIRHEFLEQADAVLALLPTESES